MNVEKELELRFHRRKECEAEIHRLPVDEENAERIGPNHSPRNVKRSPRGTCASKEKK